MTAPLRLTSLQLPAQRYLFRADASLCCVRHGNVQLLLARMYVGANDGPDDAPNDESWKHTIDQEVLRPARLTVLSVKTIDR